MKADPALLCATALLAMLASVRAAGAVGGEPSTDAPFSFSGGDGSDPARAVVVHAASEAAGIRAEHMWLSVHWPGSRLGKQALVTRDNRFYDSLQFTDAAGQTRTLYFDITDYFGK